MGITPGPVPRVAPEGSERTSRQHTLTLPSLSRTAEWEQELVMLNEGNKDLIVDNYDTSAAALD